MTICIGQPFVLCRKYYISYKNGRKKDEKKMVTKRLGNCLGSNNVPWTRPVRWNRGGYLRQRKQTWNGWIPVWL